jgi:5'-3' exonuclease
MFNIKNSNTIIPAEYIREKESSFNNDPIDGKIINNLNKDIHDSNYLEEKYSIKYYLYPKDSFYKKYEMDPDNSVKEYINGLIWIYNYYYQNKLNFSWYYLYEKAPFIEDISNYLNKLESLPLLKEEYPLLLTPIEQSIYTSPIEITDLLSKKYQYISKKFYKKYNLTDILNTINKINCNNSNYLSKCSLLKIDHPIYKLSPKQFIKEFRTESSSKEYINLIKYHEITNDPYFYNIIKNLI